MSEERKREPHWFVVCVVGLATGFVVAGLDLPTWAFVLCSALIAGVILLIWWTAQTWRQR